MLSALLAVCSSLCSDCLSTWRCAARRRESCHAVRSWARCWRAIELDAPSGCWRAWMALRAVAPGEPSLTGSRLHDDDGFSRRAMMESRDNHSMLELKLKPIIGTSLYNHSPSQAQQQPRTLCAKAPPAPQPTLRQPHHNLLLQRPAQGEHVNEKATAAIKNCAIGAPEGTSNQAAAARCNAGPPGHQTRKLERRLVWLGKYPERKGERGRRPFCSRRRLA